MVPAAIKADVRFAVCGFDPRRLHHYNNYIVSEDNYECKTCSCKTREYIAVHRGHGDGGGSSGGEGCFGLLAIIFVWLIASFWEIIVAVAILCVVGWLVWTFRHPIWHAVCWIFSKLANLVQAGYRGLQARRAQKKHTQNATPCPGAPVASITQNSIPYSSKSADYGKIRQHR